MNWEIHKSWKHDLHVYMCTTALVTPLSAGKNWKKEWQRKGDILWREKLDAVMQRSLVGKHWESGWGIGRCTNTYQLNLRQMIRIWNLKSSKWRNCLKLDYIATGLAQSRKNILVHFWHFVVFLTVLVSEGERCEVIGFIKKGECLLRRYIEVAHTFPNGKKVSVSIFTSHFV